MPKPDPAAGYWPAYIVGACGAFVAVLRNHGKIVRAHAIVNLRSPWRARSRCALILSADVAMVASLGMVHKNGSQGLNGSEALNGLAGSPSGYGPIRVARSGMPGNLDAAPAHGRCSLDRLRCPVLKAG